MITYQQEFLLTVRPELGELIQLDWEEIEHQKAVRKLDVDWDLYETLEDAGTLRIFTVRDEGKLIGYYFAMFVPSLHNKGLVQASSDVIFLHKDYRKGRIGCKLFQFAEQCLKDDGAQVMYITTTKQNPIDALMNKLGYSEIETRFEKVL